MSSRSQVGRPRGEREQCKSLTKKGTRCSKRAVPNLSGRCKHHNAMFLAEVATVVAKSKPENRRGSTLTKIVAAILGGGGTSYALAEAYKNIVEGTALLDDAVKGVEEAIKLLHVMGILSIDVVGPWIATGMAGRNGMVERQRRDGYSVEPTGLLSEIMRLIAEDAPESAIRAAASRVVAANLQVLETGKAFALPTAGFRNLGPATDLG